MQVYGGLAAVDERPDLYDRCRSTEGVEYHGSVPQAQLAQQLAGVSILAYPNTYNETSCIAVMEALAAGLLVVTSDLGGLPETCGGWARLVLPIGAGRSREEFERDFENAVDRALRELQTDPAAFYRERFEQVRAVTAGLRWDLRAAQWEQAARGWMQHA
jgi:glycosyltransferase involved in cell wall biosynthesis